jgi:CubicO group peptidase (beta-lactamase class C family)
MRKIGMTEIVSAIAKDTFWPICLALFAFSSRTLAETTISDGWQITQPAAVSLSEEPLNAFHQDIQNERYGYIDAFLVARHGKLVFEHYYEHDYASIYQQEAATPGALVVNDPSGPYNYFNPWWHPYYRNTTLHSMQSVTKSVVSALVGIALSRGEFPDLDTPVLQFFDEATVGNVDERKRDMMLRDLLTMSDGLLWDESLPYIDPDNSFAVMTKAHNWVQYALDLPMENEPGTVFNYNSGAALILGHIFRLATGIDIEEYAVENLFTPLGIDDYYWDRTPYGLTDTQEGLYISARSLARIAQLLLQKGRWQDEQVIPAAWIEESIAPHYPTGKSNDEAFGYLWWSQPYTFKGKTVRAYFGKGFGGQRPIFLPELDLVIVLTGWNILPGQPFLHAMTAVERVTAAVIE